MPSFSAISCSQAEPFELFQSGIKNIVFICPDSKIGPYTPGKSSQQYPGGCTVCAAFHACQCFFKALSPGN